MARYSNIFAGGMASCNLNGRNISIINGEVYVDGIHYVPESEAGTGEDYKPFTPGKMTDHKFDVSSDFDSIISKGFVDVVFTQSDKEDDFEVRGRLPENLIKKMNIEVSGGTLYISMKSGSYENIVVHGKAPAIYVSNKTLKDVSSSGSGDFTVNGNLNASDGFSVRSSGSSDFKCGVIKADSKDVTVSTSGSGDIELAGVEAYVFMVHISGSADVDCGTAKTKICSIDIKGSGDVKINGSTESVNFSIAGSGDIDAGDFKADTGKASVAGSGDIRCNVERLSDRVRGSGDIHNKYH